MEIVCGYLIWIFYLLYSILSTCPHGWSYVTNPTLPHSDFCMAVGYDSVNDTIWLLGGYNNRWQRTSYHNGGPFVDNVGIVYATYGYSQFYTVIDGALWMIDIDGWYVHKYVFVSGYFHKLYRRFPSKANGGCLGSFTDTKKHGYLIVNGGWDGTTLSTSRFLNLSSSVWVSCPSMQVARQSHACIVSPQTNTFYTIAGSAGTYSTTWNSVETLDVSDLSSLTWNTISNLPRKLIWHRAVIYGSDILVIGGRDETSTENNQVYSINMDTNEIATHSTLTRRVSVTAAVVRYPYIYAFGGHDGVLADVTDTWQYMIGPTTSPTKGPTKFPTYPTSAPSPSPTSSPLAAPSIAPTNPTISPTESPSISPVTAPSNAPSSQPTNPTGFPTTTPSKYPTAPPTNAPSDAPSNAPSNSPSAPPTKAPSEIPSNAPSAFPSNSPFMAPSNAPSESPSNTPSQPPSRAPTYTIEAGWIVKDDANCGDGFTDLTESNPAYGDWCQSCPSDSAGTYGICEECGWFERPNHSRTECDFYNHPVLIILEICISIGGAMLGIICYFHHRNKKLAAESEEAHSSFIASSRPTNISSKTFSKDQAVKVRWHTVNGTYYDAKIEKIELNRVGIRYNDGEFEWVQSSEYKTRIKTETQTEGV